MVNNLEKTITMHGGLIKTAEGKYKAILSDDSIDRENEIVGKGLLGSALDNKIIGLINHKNDVLGQVCEWTDKEIKRVKGHNTLIASPKWFDSNPNTKILRGMLSEGATIGISIGAIPKEHDTVTIEEKEYKRWTSGEIMEASFVAIPANKHAQIQAVAKQLNLNKTKESGTMDQEEEEAFQKKAKEIVEAMKGSKSEDIEKVLKVAEIPKDMTKDLIDKIKETEKKLSETLEKATEILESHKESSETDLVKALEEAEIPKDVIESLTKGKKEKPEEEDSEPDPKKKLGAGGKSLSEEDVTKLVDKKVNEILDKTPLFKVQKDLNEMTPEQQKDKAADLQKEGKLPILGGA